MVPLARISVTDFLLDSSFGYNSCLGCYYDIGLGSANTERWGFFGEGVEPLSGTSPSYTS